MNEAVREMTFEEEAVLYEKAARELFAKETPGCEAPPINHLVRRGVRIIRKAREEIKRQHGRWVVGKDHGEFGEAKCTACGGILLVKWSDRLSEYRYCPNCGARMEGGDTDA